MAAEVVWFESFDGTRLHGWRLPADPSLEPLGSVVFLHGNAENISTHVGQVAWLPNSGIEVFLFDYRGYGLSEGNAELGGAHHDAEAAIRLAAERAAGRGLPLVVFGQSLGGAIALTSVARVQDELAIEALVVDSAFSGFRRIARQVLGRFWPTWPLQWPLALLVPDRPDPTGAARALDVALLVVHGDADRIVPVSHAARIASAAREGRSPAVDVWIVAGADHIQSLQRVSIRRDFVRYLGHAFAGGSLQTARVREQKRTGFHSFD